MNPALVRLLRVLLVFLAGGWLAAMVVMVPDDSWTVATAWASPAARNSALAGALAGLILSPFLVFYRAQWWAGLPVGLIGGALGVWLFFFFWPHEWQAGRWNAYKSTGLFLSVYWMSLIPLTMAMGVAAVVWAQRKVRPPRWARFLEDEPEDESRTEILTSPPPPDRPEAGEAP